MIRAWKAIDELDDQAPLSAIARGSLACGRWLMARGVTQSAQDGRFEEKFGDFLRLSPKIQRCQEMTVVDIGGGTGELAAYLASRGASHVWCVEPDPDLAVQARDTLADQHNAKVVHAPGQEVSDIIGHADQVLLHEVMQHVDQPLELLRQVHGLIRPDGVAYVMFSPWRSAYGGDTGDLLPVPWLHLLYPKSVLAEIRSSKRGWHTRDLAATGLYKLTVRRFVELVDEAELEIIQMQLLPVWQQEWVLHLPVVWELGCAKVGAVLKTRI